jgi:hypothetical protein
MTDIQWFKSNLSFGIKNFIHILNLLSSHHSKIQNETNINN